MPVKEITDLTNKCNLRLTGNNNFIFFNFLNLDFFLRQADKITSQHKVVAFSQISLFKACLSNSEGKSWEELGLGGVVWGAGRENWRSNVTIYHE